MAIFINKVIMAGNLTADPEVQQTASGVPVVRFSLAVRRRYTKDGSEPVTDFHRCVAWNGQAEFIGKYARKGDLVCVEGELHNRSWTDKQSNRRYVTELNAEDVKLSSRQRDGEGVSAPAYSPARPHIEDIGGDDDLPF